MNGPMVLFCLVAAVAAIGIAFVIIGLLRIKKAFAMDDWVVASGKILSSRLSTYWGGPETGGTQFEPRIEFEYEVEGRMFLGRRWTYGRRTRFSKRAAQEIVSRYPAGRSVGVFHDPRNPKDAVLERGGAGYGTVLVLCGIVFLILGAMWLPHIEWPFAN